jgi:hypothetical protein
MQAGTAFAHFLAGRYREASSWAEKAMWEQANYRTTLFIAAASNALCGNVNEAHKAMVLLRNLDPKLRGGTIKEWAQFRRPDHLQKFEAALRKAGLPD